MQRHSEIKNVYKRFNKILFPSERIFDKWNIKIKRQWQRTIYKHYG